MFVGGIVGEMFLPFGLTVTFAMLASLVAALTLIPVLSRWLVSSTFLTLFVIPAIYSLVHQRQKQLAAE